MLIALNILALLALLFFLLSEEQRHARIKRSNEEKQAELLSTAHQLRSPLATLKKFNSLLLSKQFGKLTLAQQEIISKIHLSLAESLLGIDRLLARAHLEEGMIGNRPSTLNVRQNLDAALTAVRPKAEMKNHVLDVDGGEHAMVFGDILLLHGILNEVLLNAIAYTPQGGKIEVRVREGTDRVTITVTDQGIGIPEEERPLIFGKFFRGQQARFLASGNGLGLWFVKESVEKMAGTIAFECQRVGTAFVVTLPRAERQTA
jgi:two-component system, OmpR family, phosphate regulon sensor histidine kinase PhoR